MRPALRQRSASGAWPITIIEREPERSACLMAKAAVSLTLRERKTAPAHHPARPITLMVGVLVFEALATAAHAYIFTSTGSMIVADLRKSLYGAITRQEIGFFDKRNVGELTNRLSADVEELQVALTMNLSILMESLFLCLGASIMMISVSAELSLLVLIIVPPLALFSRWIGTTVRGKSQLRQEALARCGQLAQETFSNIRLVRAFTQGSNERKKYGEATDSALSVSLDRNRLFAGLHASGVFFQGIALLMTLWLGSTLALLRSEMRRGRTSDVARKMDSPAEACDGAMFQAAAATLSR